MTARALLCLVLALLLSALCACTGAEPAPSASSQLSPEAQARARLLEKSEKELLDDLAFGRVPAGAAADPSWFDDAAFVGDSVSVMLEYYNNARQVLGSPAFFCAENLSPRNIMISVPGSQRLPEWPRGSGERPAVPDGIAASGAGKVYLMLGMNSISGGVDNAAADLVTLVDLIRQASPGIAVFLQSVTPMTEDSPRTDEALNNETIRAYNLAVAKLCRERGWYYIDVSQALADENGFLRSDYSGDKVMGIHLNFTGTEAWADYLLTHVPEDLR